MQIGYTKEQRERLRSTCSARCSCNAKEYRLFTARNGATHVVRQCVDCGAVSGGAIPKGEHPGWEFYPPVDEALKDSGYRANNRSKTDIEKMIRQKWWVDYTEYLRSYAWHAKREMVLMRDQKRCQGCLSSDAEHVHHLTYEHVGDELLYELISLCRVCHSKVHDGHADPATERARPRDFSGAE